MTLNATRVPSGDQRGIPRHQRSDVTCLTLDPSALAIGFASFVPDRVETNISFVPSGEYAGPYSSKVLAGRFVASMPLSGSVRSKRETGVPETRHVRQPTRRRNVELGRLVADCKRLRPVHD